MIKFYAVLTRMSRWEDFMIMRQVGLSRGQTSSVLDNKAIIMTDLPALLTSIRETATLSEFNTNEFLENTCTWDKETNISLKSINAPLLISAQYRPVIIGCFDSDMRLIKECSVFDLIGEIE